MGKPEEPFKFRNYYSCERCEISWEDEWSSMCDDRCPECGVAYSPHYSEDLEHIVVEEVSQVTKSVEKEVVK